MKTLAATKSKTLIIFKIWHIYSKLIFATKNQQNARFTIDYYMQLDLFKIDHLLISWFSW